MKIQLLGTGASDGWPDPFCHCASCIAERLAGRLRANTCVLLDGVVMCDWGPTATTQGIRFGVDFSRVRYALITHGHPDHFAPQFLMWRSWLPHLVGLQLFGPASVIEEARHWVGPADELHVIAPGDRWTLPAVDGVGPWEVIALPAAHDVGHGDVHAEQAVLYDIADAEGHRVLYATDTGPLPDATLDSIKHEPWDVVMMEQTFGSHTTHGSGHHDLVSFGQSVRAMRDRGLVTDQTRVVAIHLGHHNPSTPELGEALAAIGAEVHDDGTVLHTRADIVRRHLVLGGTRSGKSSFAEELARQYPAVTVLATGYPPSAEDPEWSARVARHRARRPSHWVTHETLDLADALRSATTPVLIDCLNLWLTRILDDTWDVPELAREVALEQGEQLVAALHETRVPVIVVSNDVSNSLIPTEAVARLFQELLGELNTRVARYCDDVTMVIAGQPIRIKS